MTPLTRTRNASGRFESVGAFIIAVMLMGAGYGIGNHSFETLREVIGKGQHAATPTRLTALAAGVSIVAKEALFRVSGRGAGDGRSGWKLRSCRLRLSRGDVPAMFALQGWRWRSCRFGRIFFLRQIFVVVVVCLY